MLAFGRIFITIKTKGSYTEGNGKRVEYDRSEEEWYTIEPMKDSMYGYVKTKEKAMRDVNPDGYKSNGIYREETLYDLVDMQTGYTLARTFKTQLKPVLEHFKLCGFIHTGNGIYKADSFTLTSHRKYSNEIEQSNTDMDANTVSGDIPRS